MKRFPKKNKRAGGQPQAFRKFNPICEFLERRELLASTITFNPTGTPATQPISVGSFDFAPGNSLSTGALPLAMGKTIQLDYQAVLADVIDSNGNTVIPPGLNTSYQITAVGSFTEVVTSLNSAGTVVTFALAPTQSSNSFFELYYNPAVVANSLAGTGFNQGTLILAGTPDPNLTNSGNFALAVDGTGNPIIQPFDLFNTNNYPGILSVTGAGSALVGADVTSIDPAFFITPVVQLAFNTSTTIPFATTDPSALFVGSPGGSPPNVTPNIGTVNGVNGTDFQFQSDANNSFVAAAPAIAIAKQTNGQTALTPPGPVVQPGSTVTWTYDVTNPGNEPLKNVTVTDDNGTPGNPADDFNPTPVLAGAFNVGDTNQNGLLDPGEDWKYTFQGTAVAGQYENNVVTTAVGNVSNTSVTASSISHYFAAAPAIAIAKQTNGQTALTPPGPSVTIGNTVTWTYDVTNPGNEPLKNVTVTDDNGTPGNPADDFNPTPVLAGTFNVGDTNQNGLLDPGEDWKYTFNGIAQAGQYENTVVTTGTGNLSNTSVTANSISHYLGVAPPAPAIAIVKQTDGQVALNPSGPVIQPGATVTWTYDVTNPGNEPLKNVTVTDDNGTPANPADDFHPTPVLAGAFNVGDTNQNGLLDPGEDWKYTFSGIAQAGQYENKVVTTGVGNVSNTSVTANSISHYFAAAPAIAIVKETNGQTALTPPGPTVEAGTTVTWTYDVTNPGNEPLKNVTLTDDNGTPSNPADDFHPTPVLVGGFNVGDTNKNGLLDPGEDWKYSFQGTAQAGQYENHVVTTAAGNLSNTSVTANNVSHYLGVTPAIALVKETNGQVALNPPGPTVFVGTPVTYTYLVTNPDTVPLHNVVITDDNGTPTDPADDFHPAPVLAGGFNVGDTNQNGLLDPGETWRYEATQTAATMGPYINAATVTALSPAGLPVQAQTLSNHLNECPVVINVQRFGIHQQPTQLVVTFNGPLDPAMAQNINNYHVFTLGPDGKFTHPVPIASAVYNPANNSVTLTLAHSYNVHHLAKINVTNPCPGGPPFTGVLNRKFSLGAIDYHGHVIIPKKTNEPGVLNPAVLPKRITLATRGAELKLAKKPSSSAFVSVSMPQASQSKSWPLPSVSISAARKLLSHWTAIRDLGKHIRKTLSRGRG